MRSEAGSPHPQYFYSNILEHVNLSDSKPASPSPIPNHSVLKLSNMSNPRTTLDDETFSFESEQISMNDTVNKVGNTTIGYSN